MHIAVNVRFLLPGDKLEGIGRFTYETVRRLVAAHPQHTFHFLFDRPYDPKYLFGPNVVPHVLLPPARHPLLFVAWFEGAVAWWLRRHRPAVFLSPDGFTTLNTTVPRLTVLHDLAFVHFPYTMSWVERSHYRWFVPRYLRASTRIAAVSEATRQDIVATYGTDPQKIGVVPNAAGAHFRPQSAVAQQATRERFSAGKAYFLFVGALQPRKNLGSLLRAFDAFKTRTGAATQLLVVGRTAWQAGPIFDVYQQLQHRQDVHLTGRVTDDELVQLYAAALATVYVPYLEGFGIPVLEAQACGCPVITSNCSSLPEVAGAAAQLVDPYSVDDIAGALTTLYTQPDQRQRLAEEGLQNVQRFSWDTSAARLWQELEQVVGPEARKRP